MLAQGDKVTLTPTFDIFKMYLPHRRAQAVRAEFTAPAISNPLGNMPIPVGGNSYIGALPPVKTLAGLSGSASLAAQGPGSDNGKLLTLSVVNPHLTRPDNNRDRGPWTERRLGFGHGPRLTRCPRP